MSGDSQELPTPLKGVHFSRLSGPGPTGMRPEHLRDMLACKRRRVVNRLLRALHATEVMAAAGTLPDTWKWMLNSRLVFIAKKHGPKPRPVRVGEVWRRAVAKHSLHQHSAKIRQCMLEAHQYGVSIPGGADILIHTRSVMEESLRVDPATGVWAVVDVDFVNAFPSLEWEAVDQSMVRALPELAPWTRWCHEGAGDILLPSGGVHRAHRGAEQGDPHGSLQCGVVLAEVAREATAEFVRRKGSDRPGCFTAWYCDDGQAVCRPVDVDLYLECLDAAAAQVGATRGEGRDVKTHVRLVGHPDAIRAFGAAAEPEAWITERVRRTCQLDSPNSPFEVLGAIVGPDAACEEQFLERVQKLRELHTSLTEVADPATELTLGRACADVSRAVHLLRASGSILPETAMEEHDAALDEFIARTLGGDLAQQSLAQATVGVAQGGLGFRRASDLASPAFLASRVEARPFVERLFTAMAAEGVNVPDPMARYDSHVELALQRFEARLSLNRAAQARTFCEQAAEAATRQLAAIETGSRLEAAGAPVGAGQAGAFLLNEIGAEDAEHPASAAAAAKPRLQRALAGLVDRDRLDSLTAEAQAEGRRPDLNRLRELRDDTVSAEWLWALDPRSSTALEPDAYVAAARLRLGAGFATEQLQCRACHGVLNTGGTHAFCCAPGESTRGHNDVRDAVFDLARMADATAETEVLGLLDAAPGLRPADILTSAASPGLTSALDIGVASPDALNAGNDCTESMRLRKRRVYARHLEALRAEGIEYRPLVWSCWGREHPDTTAILTQLARQAARRQGAPGHGPLLRRARAQIGAAIARRGAAMLRACMPGVA